MVGKNRIIDTPGLTHVQPCVMNKYRMEGLAYVGEERKVISKGRRIDGRGRRGVSNGRCAGLVREGTR